MSRQGWHDVAEKGGVLGIRVMVFVATVFGRRVAHLVVPVVALYYATFSPGVRRASRDYLRRIHGEASFRAVYRHVRRFAGCTVDRLFLVQGRTDLFRFHSNGTEHLLALKEAARGAILLGAHLGSFEAMRGSQSAQRFAIHIVGDFRNARVINAALEKLNPQANARVVSLHQDHVGFVLHIKEIVERGEMVAILGDRVGPTTRAVEVDFLGGRARFPAGPFILASVLRCPVYLTFGLAHEDNRYELYCEPFAEVVDLPRKDRDRALVEHVSRYAQRLEHFCRLAPDNWFNFFDFWLPEGHGPEGGPR